MPAELKRFFTLFIYFLDLFYVRCNCAKFHHCRVYVTYFRKGGPFCQPIIREKRRILNRVKELKVDFQELNQLLIISASAKNTVISPNFLVWKFCGKAQFPHSFGRIARNYAKTVPFHKISTSGNYVKLPYFTQW